MLEDELRADNYVGAMNALAALLEGQVPGLSVPSETIAPLVSILASEAEAMRGIRVRRKGSLPSVSNDRDGGPPFRR